MEPSSIGDFRGVGIIVEGLVDVVPYLGVFRLGVQECFEIFEIGFGVLDVGDDGVVGRHTIFMNVRP